MTNRSDVLAMDPQLNLFATPSLGCVHCAHALALHHDGRCTYPACLCGQPIARRTDPETSHRAADRAAVTAKTNRALALEVLRAAGESGLTDFELAERTGIAQTSIGKRRGELRDAGLVMATEFRRPSPSGSSAIVWQVT